VGKVNAQAFALDNDTLKPSGYSTVLIMQAVMNDEEITFV
jgi:hypothetical protein